MIDTSCGDWNWVRIISKHLPDYTGLDIVENIVHVNNEKFSNSKTRFIHSDSVSFLELQADKSYDLILCRHTLEHLPSNYVISYLKEALRVGKYLLITSDHRYENIELPNNESYYRPINLELTPYDFMCKYLKDRIYDGPLIPVIDTAADLLLFET